ncbi:MAG TPA: Ig-like domain-containing protein [Gemmatimonadales bacterium]|nr:Ig-like domain-containing protein [Gemmatimonadales bacterium]
MSPIIRPLRRISLGCALLLPLALGCGGGGTTDPGPGPGPDPAPVAAVSVTPDNPLVAVDDAGQLSAKVTDADGTALTGRTVTWASLDPTLATVSGTGQVSALSYGDARIIATSEGKSDTVIVRARLRFTQVVAGGSLTCGLLASGAAWCWGGNQEGGLGARSAATESTVPVRVADNHHFTTLTVGARYACGLDADLGAWCWGGNVSGTLGNGVESNQEDHPVPVAGEHRFLAISAGKDDTCALDESRLAYCWGAVTRGMIPGQNSSDVRAPVAIAAPDTPEPITFESIQVGFTHTCGKATETDGWDLWCWGDNLDGQIVSPAPGSVYAAVDVNLTPNTYGVGSGFTCYSGVDRDTRSIPVGGCRGLSFSDLQAPPSIRDYPVAQAIAMQAGLSFACAQFDGGVLRCWGDNSKGQLGIGSKSVAVEAPVSPVGGHTWTTVDVGWEHVCGVATDGIAYCWGQARRGVLGDGTEDDRTEPTPVAGQL